jgi:hypothetical protein
LRLSESALEARATATLNPREGACYGSLVRLTSNGTLVVRCSRIPTTSFTRTRHTPTHPGPRATGVGIRGQTCIKSIYDDTDRCPVALRPKQRPSTPVVHLVRPHRLPGVKECASCWAQKWQNRLSFAGEPCMDLSSRILAADLDLIMNSTRVCCS